MAMLGDLLAAARASSGSFLAWLEASDPKFAATIAAAAAREELSFTGFVRVAVADFSRFASEEDWATLVSAMRDNADPGTVCLLAMVQWRLTARACEEHAFTPDRQGAADERSTTGPAH